jgi:hypothetical protein
LKWVAYPKRGNLYLSKQPYEAGTNGKCPHCGHEVVFPRLSNLIQGNPVQIHQVNGSVKTISPPKNMAVQSGGDTVWLYASKCPNLQCLKPIVIAKVDDGTKIVYRLVHPSHVLRVVPEEVPKEIRQDFVEAFSVLPISEKASAALSRRCLENLLKDRNYKGKDLNEQMDLALKDLPKEIAENFDAIRQIGNFAAHPKKFQSSGEIADVEFEEAKWSLDVLEQLFDFYYVQPKISEQKRDALNVKLKDLGKLPLKKP